MPLQKPKGKSKAAKQKAIAANIRELINANKSKPASKKRPLKQIQAIAFSAAGLSKKKKKK